MNDRSLDKSLTSDIPGPFLEHRLSTLRHQLVENALEAVDGLESPRIEFRLRSEAEHTRIGVKENGCGIKQKGRSKIFVPLFTTKPKRKGLGLSIALKLMAGVRATGEDSS